MESVIALVAPLNLTCSVTYVVLILWFRTSTKRPRSICCEQLAWKLWWPTGTEQKDRCHDSVRVFFLFSRNLLLAVYLQPFATHLSGRRYLCTWPVWQGHWLPYKISKHPCLCRLLARELFFFFQHVWEITSICRGSCFQRSFTKPVKNGNRYFALQCIFVCNIECNKYSLTEEMK